EHSGSLQVLWNRGSLDGALVVTHGGSRADLLPVFPYDRLVTGSYTTLDLNAGISLGALTPWVKLENLLDEEYEEVRGFPAPGRRAIVGLRYSR
ncbi:MAG TPA: hypothetical protein VM534_10780, partial [Thermoanaerobaculia bacterium]|nr:hypothetical protein [Thermoanaerobaculia bacterium]